MSENKIPEQAAAQESRSQCRDAGRGFHGYSTFSGGLTNSQAQKSIKEVNHLEST